LAELPVLLALFLAAFGSATLLPMQSEALLLGLLWAGKQSTATLLLVATAGNVLGSLLNWVLGRYLEHFRERRWFPFKPAQLQRAQNWYARHGRWSLLLSWVPVIGDPLTLVAGVLGEPLWRFLLLVTLAKGGRYLALAMLAPLLPG
jgi:membrane protein YqaA with SNARE-associated domain